MKLFCLHGVLSYNLLILCLCRGFSVSTVNRVHVFKPVSVQAMWWVTSVSKYLMSSEHTVLPLFTLTSFSFFLIFLLLFGLAVSQFSTLLSYTCQCGLLISSCCYPSALPSSFNILSLNPQLSTVQPCLRTKLWSFWCRNIKHLYSVLRLMGKSSSFCCRQVRPAVAAQSLRGGSLPQLLPREPVPDLGQLLPEQSLFQPVLCQRMERHAGCRVAPCQLTHPLHRPVSGTEA